MSKYKTIDLIEMIGKEGINQAILWSEIGIIKLTPLQKKYLASFLTYKGKDMVSDLELIEGEFKNDQRRKIRNSILNTLIKFVYIKQAVDFNEKDSLETNYGKLYQFVIGDIVLKNGLNDFYEKHFKKQEIFKEELYRYSEKQKMSMYLQEINHITTIRNHYRNNSTNNLNDAILLLDSLYWTDRLKLACENRNRSMVYSIEIKDANFNVIEVLNESKILKEHVLSENINSAYYHIYKMLTDRNKYSYEIVLDKLPDFLKIDSDNERADILGYVLNYCINEVNFGNYLYAKRYLAFIKIMEDYGFLLSNDIIDLGKFKCIIDMNIIVGDYKNAIAKLNEYYQNLPIEDKDAYREFHLQNITFHSITESVELINKNKLKGVLDYVRKQSLSEDFHKIAFRKLEAKAFFIEQLCNNEINQSLEKLGNFRRTIKYHESNYEKRLLLPLERLAKVLIQIVKAGKNKEKRNEIYYTILNTEDVITDKWWLLKIIKPQ